MDKTKSNMAHQIALAVRAFEQQRTGHVPQAVSVVLNQETLVITLHGVLSQAEKDLARSPAGAVQVQEFHRQLFASAAHSLRQDIKRITGVEVCEAAADVEPLTGSMVQTFMSGTVIQVFLLTSRVPTGAWSSTDPGNELCTEFT